MLAVYCRYYRNIYIPVLQLVFAKKFCSEGIVAVE